MGFIINPYRYTIPYISATGGTITTDGDYKVHSFTTVGNTNFVVTGSGTVEYLVIGGGGGASGGGGGAGG